MSGENMPVVKLSTNGRVTLPLKLRERYQLRAGDKINFVRSGEGYLLQVVKSVQSVKGVLKNNNQSISVDEMNQAIADAVVSHYKEFK